MSRALTGTGHGLGTRRSLAILGSRGVPARYGGFETFAEELATRLVRRGHTVTVFCERGRETPREHAGVRLVHVRVPPLGPFATLAYDLACLWRARRGHDVVYMLGYGAALFCWLPRLAGREVWINMDGLEWRRRKWGPLARLWLRAMERCALRVAQRVVFDSAAVRAAVAGGAAAAHARVIEYGATPRREPPDPGVLAALGLRAGGYCLLVARIEPENHVLELVRACARGPRELVVVGDWERAGRYGRACRAAAGSNVRFLGAVHDGPTLHALRAQASAILHGHSVGGTNPALLEALAAGVPVLAHDNPFNREVLGEDALTFHDEPSLEAALRALEALTGEERAALGARARERVQARYDWERIVDEYARLLGGTARQAGPPAGAGPDPAAPLPRAPDAVPGGRRA